MSKTGAMAYEEQIAAQEALEVVMPILRAMMSNYAQVQSSATGDTLQQCSGALMALKEVQIRLEMLADPSNQDNIT